MIGSLGRDADREAVCGAVASFCRSECDEARVRAAAGTLDTDLWRALAELGVLALGTPEGEGGALELVAAFEALGEVVFPGPLVETVAVAHLLPAADRRDVCAGARVAAWGRPPLLAWAPVADLFVAQEGRRAWLGRPVGPVERLDTLGGDPWARVELIAERDLGDAQDSLAWSRLAAAAYLGGAASRLVEAASEHARTRRQFGRAIGDFQAVALPLADAAIGVDASRMLARLAAAELDAAAPGAAPSAAAAWLSARSSGLAALYTAHQVFGAVGITVEGPAFPVSRRIRHLASLPLVEEDARALLLEERGLGGSSARGASA